MYLATKVLYCFVFGRYNVTIFPTLGVLRVEEGYMKYEPLSSGFFKLKERSIYFDIFFIIYWIILTDILRTIVNKLY